MVRTLGPTSTALLGTRDSPIPAFISRRYADNDEPLVQGYWTSNQKVLCSAQGYFRREGRQGAGEGVFASPMKVLPSEIQYTCKFTVGPLHFLVGLLTIFLKETL